ncbi:MAG: tRNA (5-methylaminomethyl-2-thiouridine)(34)-methyltransferase MnmD [Bacteroidales bacterium]
MVEIIKTGDGSDTLYVPELDEHYHSVNGAIRESEFIFIEAGFNSCLSNPVRIFEAGFGTGLNVLLTAIRNLPERRQVYYTSIENFPLPEEIISALNYKDYVSPQGKQLFDTIHSCEWNTLVKIDEGFYLNKVRGDLESGFITGSFDLIYYDAFGPDKQPGMWSDEVIKKISEHTVKNGILVTYSAKGEVKRRLIKYGFEVSLLPGPPGKRQMIRAVKI